MPTDDRGGPRSDVVVLIPKPLRAEWMGVMAMDLKLSPIAYRVACVIGCHFNNIRGSTYVRQETIAALMDLDVRTVQRAIRELEHLGYLLVERRELGVRASDGRRVCGGKGVANTYMPAFERERLTATSAGRKLAERLDRIAGSKAAPEASNDGSPEGANAVLHEFEGRPADRPSKVYRTANDNTKDGPRVVPTLTDSSNQNSTRGCAGARGDAPEHPLGDAALALENRIGAGQFQIWFSDIDVIFVGDGRLVLGVRSRFVKDWLINHFADAVRDCWNQTHRDAPLEQIGGLEFQVRS